MQKKTDQLDTAALQKLADTCVCTHMRIASRVVTQFYDTFLQPTGLRMTQFTILVVIALFKQKTVIQLAEKLAMDRSALARSLKSLEEQGLLTIQQGRDRRTRMPVLTSEGRQALARALLAWKEAQEHLAVRLGEQRTTLLLSEFKNIKVLRSSIE